MESKPVITYNYVDAELIGPVFQKKLQSKLKTLQLDNPLKDESSFNPMCDGIKFTYYPELPSPHHLPLYTQPALHTFWTCFVDDKEFQKTDRDKIRSWLDKCQSEWPEVECLVVYVFTALVRSKRGRTFNIGKVEEKIRAEFKGRVDVTILRQADSDTARWLESYNSLAQKINSLCLSRFLTVMKQEEELAARQAEMRIDVEQFYRHVFIRKLDLAVSYEITSRNEAALAMYSEAITDLETALTQCSQAPPTWMRQLSTAPCTSWDYPKFVWSQLSWTYVHGIRSITSPLLHVRTFFLARLAHLLFALGRAWSVSELVISTLHCMAREIKTLNLCFPEGAFDCWAYMTCNEAIQGFMALISPDSLVSATSNLLLVRAELWHYALQKLELIGGLCGVMPSSNKLNHDKVLIKQITSGIHPVALDSVPDSKGIEDYGLQLINTLNDRQKFQTEFLKLGEMVIGAFKFAGRRRMAFRVGATIAQFHKDLGLIVEAEDLLSDICKFYSEDQWTQLSTNAFSLLADCQIKLKLEDKYVNTMLLLASLPPYPGASHEPQKWFTSLANIAQRSPYQKLLNWAPMLTLTDLVILNSQVTIGDTVHLELRLQYHGPAAISNLIATVELRGESGPTSLSVPTSPSQAPTPPLAQLLEQLENLDLNTDRILESRPIGGEGKFRANSTVVTHISAADIAELAEEDIGRGKPAEMLRAMGVALVPGGNKITLSGKVCRAGEFSPGKINLKWGCLDFVHTLLAPPTITVSPLTVNIELVFLADTGLFIEGESHDTHLMIKVGANTTIPENAVIRLDAGAGVTCSESQFRLPALGSGDTHYCPLSVALDRNSTVESFPDLAIWDHEVTVYCDWLNPVHSAVVPMATMRPLVTRLTEHCGGGCGFLKVELLNMSPLPLALTNTKLQSSLHLTPLHTQPQVLYPRESYSLLWGVDKTTPTPGKLHTSTLSLQYLPCLEEQPTSHLRTLTTSLSHSDLQPVFEVRSNVSCQDQAPPTLNKPATLTYELKATVPLVGLPDTMGYTVAANEWGLSDRGVVTTPTKGESTVLCIICTPRKSGLVPLPNLCLDIDGLAIGGGQMENISLGQLVSVVKE